MRATVERRDAACKATGGLRANEPVDPQPRVVLEPPHRALG
jgi:hypothetical protein